MKERTRKVIINTLAADGDNFLAVSDESGVTTGYYIVDDHVLDSPVHYSPFIPAGSIKSVSYLASQAEVTGIHVLGQLEETILAGERYALSIDQVGLKSESGFKPAFKYAYTAPNPLSGNSDTDRATVYNALASKINAYAGNNVTAYPCYRIAYISGSDDGTSVVGTATVDPLAAVTTADKVRVGTQGTQETSGVTANIAAIEITAGTIAGDDAAGYIWIYNVSDIASWDAGLKYIQFDDATGAATETIKVTTNATPTAAQALVIVDDAGYFPARPNNNNRGPSTVKLTDGFTTATSVQERTPLISRGIGSRLDDDNAVLLPDGTDVISGSIENANPYGDGAFDSSKTYRTYILQYEPDASVDGLTNFATKGPQQLIIYADESNNTNLGTFNSAIIALT